MRIEYLADHASCIPTLAAWHHAQFGYLNPGTTIEQRIDKFHGFLQKRHIPTTFVALSGDILLGSANLLEYTIDSHKHLSPWLGSVFVAPEHRGKGIGSSLVCQAVRESAAMGVKKLYLFTPQSESLYARLGWRTIDHSELRGHPVAIMEIEVCV